jgi:hypothetical protein
MLITKRVGKVGCYWLVSLALATLCCSGKQSQAPSLPEPVSDAGSVNTQQLVSDSGPGEERTFPSGEVGASRGRLGVPDAGSDATSGSRDWGADLGSSSLGAGVTTATEAAEIPASCGGWKPPTPEEVQRHIDTFGCPPCKCSCVNGRVRCAPCQPCRPDPKWKPKYEPPLLPDARID